jgi:histidine triad (HIT) family protein
MAEKYRRDDDKDNKPCQFCAIAAGEVSAYVVFEDAISIAFLDYRPLFPGHCLLITRPHYATLIDLPSDVIGPLFSNAQLLAGTVQRVMQADGTFVAMNNVVSQSVPHFHIHIVPRWRGDGLRGFFWPRHKMRDEELESVQKRLVDGIKGRSGKGVNPAKGRCR